MISVAAVVLGVSPVLGSLMVSGTSGDESTRTTGESVVVPSGLLRTASGQVNLALSQAMDPAPTPTPSAAATSVPRPDEAPAPAAHCPALGLFVSSETQGALNLLDSQLGVTAKIMTVYASNNYTVFTPPSTPLQLLLGVGEVTPAEATTIGATLVASGHANTMIRIMWEMNGNWFPWGVQSLPAAQYITIYRAAEQAFAAVPGNHFQYVWNVNAGTAESGRTEFDTYPGSAYVSNIGMDYYDYGPSSQSWIPPVLAFAEAQGRPVSFDEWGLNGQDDPGYIDFVASVVHDPSDDVTAEAYFSDGNSSITQFPSAEAEYRKDFTGSC
ncbi:MAG: glycosyl hydrolase [Candidatus Dormibacteria bacterium]